MTPAALSTRPRQPWIPLVLAAATLQRPVVRRNIRRSQVEGAGAGTSVDSAASSPTALRASKALFLAMARLPFLFLAFEACKALRCYHREKPGKGDKTNESGVVSPSREVEAEKGGNLRHVEEHVDLDRRKGPVGGTCVFACMHRHIYERPSWFLLPPVMGAFSYPEISGSIKFQLQIRD